MEAGEASKIVELSKAGVPLAETQADLTPFQRMVMLQEIERQNQKEKEQAEQAQNGGHSRSGGAGQVNSLRQPNGGQGETVTYVNEHAD